MKKNNLAPFVDDLKRDFETAQPVSLVALMNTRIPLTIVVQNIDHNLFP